eukprot:TRINITY_DN66421_c0_g1_i1.p2 TRINITY_DN66421_c0_g1~~TRINITY_DN66421_c0_g1_i1.p2  ORF type:complete len:192 (+),score=5.30 TRINITY_DN66421_c0_g1_i1:174-749(+)
MVRMRSKAMVQLSSKSQEIILLLEHVRVAIPRLLLFLNAAYVVGPSVGPSVAKDMRWGSARAHAEMCDRVEVVRMAQDAEGAIFHTLKSARHPLEADSPEQPGYLLTWRLRKTSTLSIIQLLPSPTLAWSKCLSLDKVASQYPFSKELKPAMSHASPYPFIRLCLCWKARRVKTRQKPKTCVNQQHRNKTR